VKRFSHAETVLRYYFLLKIGFG